MFPFSLQKAKTARRRILCGVLLTGAILSLTNAALASHRPVIVASTSMIASLLQDIGGTQFEVVTLLSPSSCPGQFDLRPNDVTMIRSADLIVAHPYQKDLQSVLRTHVPQDKNWLFLPEEGNALTIPGHYRTAGRFLLAELSSRYPEKARFLKAAWTRQEGDIMKLENTYRAEFRQRQAISRAVLVAYHQKDFVQSWGFPVAGVFDTPEGLSLQQFSDLIRQARAQRVAAVIGNLQNGDRQARAIAEKAGVSLVMLNNFPDTEPGKNSFVDLLNANCAKLLQVLR